jgi:zeta-carotene desaturase
VLFEEGPDGKPVVTGLRMRKAGKDTMLHADCYVAALDCQGAKKLIPSAWRKFPIFDNIHKLEGVPVITVQLRFAITSASMFPFLVQSTSPADHHRHVTIIVDVF